MVRQRVARGFGLRVFVLLVVIFTWMSSVSLVFAKVKAEAAPAAVTQAPDEMSASLAARKQGSKVEVSSKTSETTRVFAEPSGSFTLEQSVMPERVRRGAGWINVDTTLETRADGTVAPKATAADVSFSGGGLAALARMKSGSGTLTLKWRGQLSPPTLSGDTATYPEVLPDVDLRVRATVRGFSHELLVKSPAAAANPALAKVTFDLATTGVAMAGDKDGNMRGVDAAGAVLFQAPAPRMWDTPAVQARSADPVAAKTAAVGLEVGNGQVSLIPDKALLTDPNAGFPLVIDPDYSAVTPERSAWALVRKGLPGQVNFNIGPRDADERDFGVVRVGRVPDQGPDWIDRSLFRFDTTAVRGAQINRATVQVFQLWKYLHTCDANAVAPVELYWTGTINEGTSWNTQPNWGAPIASANSVPKIGHCATDWVGMDARGAVQQAANIGANDITLGIKATDPDENAARSEGWKRFDSKPGFFPKLFMEYNNPPNGPQEVGTDPPLRAPCRWCEGVSYIDNDFITLKARLSDPNGGQLRALWEIWHPGQENREQWLASGSMFGTPMDLRGSNGVTYGWRVFGNDGSLSGPAVEGPRFTVDLVGPDQKPGVTGRLYQADNAWHGGVGLPDTFTFTANGVADIDRYRYWFTGGNPVEINADRLGGNATPKITPPIDGPVDLFVQSIDRAGRASPTATYHFYVRPGNGPASNWPLDGNAKDESLLGGRNGTAAGNVTWTPGATGSAVELDGSGGHVSAPNPVRTDGSFSVAAWVELGQANDVSRIAVSQDGQEILGFTLEYDGGAKNWVFAMPENDAAVPTGWDVARAPGLAVAGTWTHLAGVYDASASEIRLYVNGVLAGTGHRNGLWNAAGSLRIGRGTVHGNPVKEWRGAIDDVRLYDRTLTPEAVRALVTKDDIQVAHWKFDETRGTTASNAVEGGDAAVLQGTAKFVADGQADGAVKFSSSNDYVSSSGPIVRTDQSFAIATWVKLDQPPSDGNAATVVSAEGNVVSSFLLSYRAVDGGRWELLAPPTDTAEQSGGEVVRSNVQAKLNTWTHITAVYDASAKQIRLYVDGALSGTAARTKGFNTTGPLLVGRGKWNGSPANPWTGSVDELRVYSRTLDNAEILGIFTHDSVAAGSWKLDGTTVDDSKNAKHGTAFGGPTWVAGQSVNPDPTDQAIHLDGVDDYIKAAPSIDTSASFSAAAWVKVDPVNPLPDWAAVVSQSGVHTSVFNLGFDAGKRWTFAMHGPDDGTLTEVTRVFSDQALQPGVWTHIAGVYDAVAGEMRLYVNGVLAATGQFRTKWNATGELDIGRAKWYDQWTNYAPAAVDDVKLYSRALFQDETSLLAGRDLTLIHNLRLDEASGGVAADSVGARPGTLAGGATFAAGRSGNAIKLDGVDDQVTTTGMDLRTDSSFTVAAWVNLSNQGGQLTAVSVDGNRTSKFRLGHVKDAEHRDGSWIFEMPEADNDANPVTRAAVSTLSNELNSWVHLVGVYDAPAKKVWLYVNGSRVGDGQLNTPWQPAGGLVLGRGKLGGSPQQFWPGLVDDVRLYTGRLDRDRVLSLYQSYPAPVN
jgi:hypothetical protein